MKNFENTLHSQIEDIVNLPLLHTCDAFTLRAILQSKELTPQMCDVFKSNLLYTYYGVPSYRLNYNNATVNSAYYPICIILDSSKIDGIHKIYPFDSGAFVKADSIIKDFFHHRTKVEDFELEGTIDSAKKVIKTFYESNENYIEEKPKEIDFSHFDFEASGYKNLISNTQNSPIDNRASSIEVIFDKCVHLNKDTVKQLIIPNCFKDDKKIMELLEEYNIFDPIGYSTFRGKPSEYYSILRHEYLNFLNN